MKKHVEKLRGSWFMLGEEAKDQIHMRRRNVRDYEVQLGRVKRTKRVVTIQVACGSSDKFDRGGDSRMT